jgi:hypothetical protein
MLPSAWHPLRLGRFHNFTTHLGTQTIVCLRRLSTWYDHITFGVICSSAFPAHDP